MNNSVAGSTSCSRDSMYEVFCSSSYDPPKAFLSSVRDPSKMVEIIDISETQLRVRNEATIWCTDYMYISDSAAASDVGGGLSGDSWFGISLLATISRPLWPSSPFHCIRENISYTLLSYSQLFVIP
ncbi:hypothetical protein Droror1_Dr00013018 [Drosera rotundifolia]